MLGRAGDWINERWRNALIYGVLERIHAKQRKHVFQHQWSDQTPFISS